MIQIAVMILELTWTVQKFQNLILIIQGITVNKVHLQIH